MAADRRPTLPCWSADETVALINAYRKKWYSLRRGKLQAPDWQEVTDAVAVRCPAGLPPKTSVQCGRKMDKLRQRYRAELQRIDNPYHKHNPNPNNNKLLSNKYSSSWIYFKLMDSLESGVDCSDPSVDLPRMDRNNEDDIIIKKSVPGPLLKQRAGARIKFPNTISDNDVSSLDDFPPPIGGEYGSGKNGSGGVYSGGVKRKGEGSDGDVMGEMTGAIKRLGDGFVNMERVKMNMTRELEFLRMKMESERTEMVLETQRKVLDLVAKTVVEKSKKIKGMGVTEL